MNCYVLRYLRGFCCGRRAPTSVSRCYRESQHACRRGVHSDLKLEYESLVAAGELRFDPHQIRAVEQLKKLQQQLNGYEPGQPRTSSLLKLFKSSQCEQIKGIYMHGSVGAGKTMLMDLFFKAAAVSKKQRVHFNSFMLDVHHRVHHFKQSLPQPTGREKPHAYDPISPVAQQIAEECHLLCFDEFQVTDIADAVILRRLFTTLFENGVVVVTTSNRHPDDLYKNGLQRVNFIPFIHILKQYCEVFQLDSGVDYRQKVLATAGHVYNTPNTSKANQRLLDVFEDLAEEENTVPGPRVLMFLGRKLVIPKAAASIAVFTFDELCGNPLSAADYLELCRHFDTLFIRDIPQMTEYNLTEARRFITLIDTLYNHKVKVICTAAVPPHSLFMTTPQNATQYLQETRILMDDLEITEGETDSKASIFTGEEEIFAFKRTVSRLIEMQGEEYWNSSYLGRSTQ